MKLRLNPLILGAFIIGGFAIAIAALLALGSSTLFGPTGHFVFYLKNSSQSLNAGTSVKLDGVQVGQVDRIRVIYDPATRQSFVAVICRINHNRLVDVHNRRLNLTDPEVLRGLVANGLCAQVQTAGIVGAKFVELSFFKHSERVLPADFPASKYCLVPTVPSTMSQISEDIPGILAHLRATDFAGMARQLKQVLASAEGQIGELQTNRFATRVSTAAQSFNQFMVSPDLRQAVANVRDAASRFQTLVTNLDARVGPLGTNLDSTLASAHQTAKDLQDFVALRNQLGQQTQDLLKQLDRTARSVQELADFLQRHPNALIAGRAENPGTP